MNHNHPEISQILVSIETGRPVTNPSLLDRPLQKSGFFFCDSAETEPADIHVLCYVLVMREGNSWTQLVLQGKGQ